MKDNIFIYTKKYDDENMAQICVKKIKEITKDIYKKYYVEGDKEMILTESNKHDFINATHCHICKEEINPRIYKKSKLRDHNHFTGKYRGAAHESCNSSCKKPQILPVIFHNLQGYDSHLFINEIGKLEGKLECIPSTEEKYLTFSKTIKVATRIDLEAQKEERIYFEIKFIDSFKFMHLSLAKPVGNLQKDEFINLKKINKTNTKLLTSKGVYPYEYVNSLEKFKETKLPPIEEFYSQLNDENISQEDYDHAQNVYETFNCKTLRDYHNLYLKTDVLLLADVFENFRKTCMKHYQLDPAHYLSAPGLAWDACLKETGQKLELLSDYDMLMFFEKGERGGMCHISKRYSEANNKYMKDYDPNKPSKFIQYLDANNLYGWAMIQRLPNHGFKWLPENTFSIKNVINILNKSFTNHGYVFEVDLEDPKELRELHNDYPLAPHKLECDKVEKLVSTFLPKTNYVLHYQNLIQYLQLGMKLKKVHRGIQFFQSEWMKPCIEKNTKLRMESQK